MPLRYGMTIGELAQMFKAERKLKVDLTVIPLEGWTRNQWFDETAQPWDNLSPNMRSLTEATLYAGIGVLNFAGFRGSRNGNAVRSFGRALHSRPEIAARIEQTRFERRSFCADPF